MIYYKQLFFPIHFKINPFGANLLMHSYFFFNSFTVHQYVYISVDPETFKSINS